MESPSAARALPAPEDPEQRSLPRTQPSLLQAIRGWLRTTLRERHEPSLKEVLEEAIEEHEEQAEEPLAPEEKLMLHNVLSFSDIKVADIMVPRADIAAVPQHIGWSALQQHIAEMRHTRIPVYENTLDNVVGFIHVKDLLSHASSSDEFRLARVLRPLLFVPPSMRLLDLLVTMRQASCHMAIVIDEYGGTDGLVTMEDVFEEIVGDIQDEHDEEEDSDEYINRISDTVFEVSARIPLDALVRELHLDLRPTAGEADFETLGGLIFFHLGRVPVRGEIIRHPSGIRFEIVEADPRRIRKVRLLTASSAQ